MTAGAALPPVVEMPFLCNAVVEHTRTYQLRADVAGDAPLVELPDGGWLRPLRVTASWTYELGPGWVLCVVQADGPAPGAPVATVDAEVLTRWWLPPGEPLPGWLARLLEREHPAAVVGS